MNSVAKQPFVSVIIPLKEIGYYVLFENLPHFTKQTYKHFEVLLLPNDPSPQDRELLKKYPWLRIIHTGKITRPAQKRNRGVKEAKGDIIAFIDDDAYPTDTWLEEAVQICAKKNVAAVCGPGVLPPHAGVWEQAFDATLQTFIGAGGYSYRFIPGKPRFVDDYPSMNFLIRKNVFEEIGGFDNDYWPGEDSKLCEELIYKKKEHIFYDPALLIYHHRRNNLSAYLKQHGQYGYHRGAFFAHGDRNSRRLAYLIPTLFVLYLVAWLLFLLYQALTGFGVYFLLFSLPLLVYLLGTSALFATVFLAKKNPLVAAYAVISLVSTHIVYGILFVKGFITGYLHKENIYG